jgi:predicted metal-dependent hydrolase
MLQKNQITVIRRAVKHARLRVHEDASVELIAPDDLSEKEIENLLARKSLWIAKQQAFFRDRPLDHVVLNADEIELLGQVYRWEIHRDVVNGISVDEQKRTICAGEHFMAPNARHSWHRSFARDYLVRRTNELADTYHFHVSAVYIRAQRTKWGSCSSRKTVSLNWRLIIAPVVVIDYVILHELMHTMIMDHGHRFWVSLAAICPNYKGAIDWLQRNRPERCSEPDRTDNAGGRESVK